ncbi:hypothetical protein L207DRAFT_440534 [Hyaloscypha variabilis F]|uniref:Integral membrane protein n=1 Tax=Hyaloscypha variabilis (strain UAMH 11265 / GT02V1 / F) TaxID=1149755 RepID=A0A2J6R1P4_HYAVF|nr:hypothetical protein L207DRAFT_440534 [Hyaloscypha variabilis F]
MPEVAEEITSPTTGNLQDGIDSLPTADLNTLADVEAGNQTPGRLNRGSVSSWRPLRRARTNIGRAETQQEKDEREGAEYDAELVDILDLVDPEVQALQTLTNVQNSLVIPYLGRYLNRRPTYTLSRRPAEVEETESASDAESGAEKERPKVQKRPTVPRTHTGATLETITSRVNDRYYAVLPHGVTLPGWTEEEKLELNDHVRHMLHSRRSKFKRAMKGFGQYVKRPLGLFVTVYATLITLFGLIWVLFLIGWINVGGRHDYIINVIDNVLVALFAIIGDGMAPFRTVDTYHMCFIAHYHHLTWRLRKECALPQLQDQNDLPAVQRDQVVDVEKQEFSVLSPEQQKRLAHHQKKFARSHSFYKPHETATHHAFPLRLLVAVVVLLDCHSLLQIALGTCTWSISYHVRPFALTTVILCCSITCNITAGVLISIGDHKTRKKDVLEKMFRQELTKTAMKKVEKKRGKDISRSTTDEGLWGVVDEAAEGVEHDLQAQRTHGTQDLEGEGEDDVKEEKEEREDTDTEFETPLSNPASEGASYMPIQAQGQARSIPRIVTTTTSNHGPGGMSTTTTTHVS